MSTRSKKFWLFYDPEGEIYESLSWDLPGFRPAKQSSSKPGKVKKKVLRGR